jgi:ferrochelatase
MHEQSETLAELDDDLRGKAEERGLEFFRVPIPYLAPEFVTMMADLVESVVRS